MRPIEIAFATLLASILGSARAQAADDLHALAPLLNRVKNYKSRKVHLFFWDLSWNCKEEHSA